MNRLEKKIEELKRENRKALVAFLTAGYPDADATAELVLALEKNGADIVEIGIPFSDPMTDGPTIQYSSQQALDRGMTLEKVFDLVRAVRTKSSIPLLLMGYLNPVLHAGLDTAVRHAAEAGVDGFIIPDASLEESGSVKEACDRAGLSMVLLAAPNTPDKRLSLIDRQASGFVYIVSIAGVTGGRSELPPSIRGYLKRTKKYITRHPRFVGFGISKPEQVRRLKEYADGVIVGSALIDIVRSAKSREEMLKRTAVFARSLRAALDN